MVTATKLLCENHREQMVATLPAELAADTGGELATFSFRGVSPLLDTAPFSIHGRRSETGMDLWAANPSAGLAMTAKATFR